MTKLGKDVEVRAHYPILPSNFENERNYYERQYWLWASRWLSPTNKNYNYKKLGSWNTVWGLEYNLYECTMPLFF